MGPEKQGQDIFHLFSRNAIKDRYTVGFIVHFRTLPFFSFVIVNDFINASKNLLGNQNTWIAVPFAIFFV